jgi:hypothetical protein
MGILHQGSELEGVLGDARGVPVEAVRRGHETPGGFQQPGGRLRLLGGGSGDASHMR